MSEIRVGDRVQFRAGRGYAVGRVVNMLEGMATIATDKGKNVNRLVKMLTRIVETEPAPAQPVEAVPHCSMDAI